jgi:hypothetical protein
VPPSASSPAPASPRRPGWSWPTPATPDAGKRKGARPGWDGGRYTFMRRVLETELGKQLYGKRQATIEPVFANTKTASVAA